VHVAATSPLKVVVSLEITANVGRSISSDPAAPNRSCCKPMHNFEFSLFTFVGTSIIAILAHLSVFQKTEQYSRA